MCHPMCPPENHYETLNYESLKKNVFAFFLQSCALSGFPVHFLKGTYLCIYSFFLKEPKTWGTQPGMLLRETQSLPVWHVSFVDERSWGNDEMVMEHLLISFDFVIRVYLLAKMRLFS